MKSSIFFTAISTYSLGLSRIKYNYTFTELVKMYVKLIVRSQSRDIIIAMTLFTSSLLVWVVGTG